MVNKMIRFFILFLLLFTACQKKPTEGTMQSTLRIDFQEGDLPSLHPHELVIYLRGISLSKTLYEGLTRIDPQGKPQLAGAKSVEISPDGLHYTFKLRPNRWSDGSPVTASHYEKAWKEALSPVSFCKRADLLFMIKNAKEAKKGEAPLEAVGIRSLDDQTLAVELIRPSPQFIELVAQPICAPLKNPQDKTISHFNGPFLVEKWERNALLTLKPNPYFWNSKQVALSAIEVSMVQDTETAFSLYEQKKFDWIGVPLCPLSSEQVDYLRQKQELKSHPIDRAFLIFLNTAHPSLSSSSIRKALSLAIRRDEIAQNIFIGTDPLLKALPKALLPKQPQRQVDENETEARKLFEAGLSELGHTRDTFPPLVITYSQQANRKQLAEYLQQAWSQALGIQVKLEPQEWNVLRNNLGTGQFQISGCFEASYCHDPLELMERLITLNPSNFSQWTLPLYQEKVTKASLETDPEKRLQWLSEAEGVLLDHMPFIPICSDRFLFAHHPKLKGYTFDSVGAIDFSYADLKP